MSKQLLAFPKAQPWTPTGNPFLGDLPRCPALSTTWRKKSVAPIHRALRKAIPELSGLRPLSKSDMDLCLSRARSATSVEDARYWYQEANLLKRYIGPELSDPSQREAEAVEKLLLSNERCKHTNEVFLGDIDASNAKIPPEYLRKLGRARSILARILGVFPMDAFPRACDFTPGATTEFPRKIGGLHNKWALAAHCSSHATPYVHAFREWAGIAPTTELIIDNFNSVFTVPKDSFCDRTACRPVTWNGFLQKGVGKLMKRRAVRVGLLRPTAQEEHQLLAKLGSATGALSARDLKSASDSVSTHLVASLFPPSWSKVLMDLREEWGLLPDGSAVRWEMLSTMGNGFTFETETLLFYALVKACCSKESLVSTYGDDIIFPQQYAEQVDELLTFCGFLINRDKSTTLADRFMESCGGHFFDGHSIKPMYLQRLPSTLGDVINLHNEIIRISGGRPRPGTRWFPVWSSCRAAVPRKFWGPVGLEGCLWSDWDEATPSYNPWVQAHYVACVSRCVGETEDLFDHIGAYLQKLWCVEDDIADSAEFSRYQKTGTRERGSWVYVHHWPVLDRVTRFATSV